MPPYRAWGRERAWYGSSRLGGCYSWNDGGYGVGLNTGSGQQFFRDGSARRRGGRRGGGRYGNRNGRRDRRTLFHMLAGFERRDGERAGDLQAVIPAVGNPDTALRIKRHTRGQIEFTFFAALFSNRHPALGVGVIHLDAIVALLGNPDPSVRDRPPQVAVGELNAPEGFAFMPIAFPLGRGRVVGLQAIVALIGNPDHTLRVHGHTGGISELAHGGPGLTDGRPLLCGRIIGLHAMVGFIRHPHMPLRIHRHAGRCIELTRRDAALSQSDPCFLFGIVHLDAVVAFVRDPHMTLRISRHTRRRHGIVRALSGAWPFTSQPAACETRRPFLKRTPPALDA